MCSWIDIDMLKCLGQPTCCLLPKSTSRSTLLYLPRQEHKSKSIEETIDREKFTNVISIFLEVRLVCTFNLHVLLVVFQSMNTKVPETEAN
jgi:hypothetical protein